MAGPLLVRVQGEDRCGLRQKDVHITVTGGPPDTGPPDTGADDTGDTGDTGAPDTPVPAPDTDRPSADDVDTDAPACGCATSGPTALLPALGALALLSVRRRRA